MRTKTRIMVPARFAQAFPSNGVGKGLHTGRKTQRAHNSNRLLMNNLCLRLYPFGYLQVLDDANFLPSRGDLPGRLPLQISFGAGNFNTLFSQPGGNNEQYWKRGSLRDKALDIRRKHPAVSDGVKENEITALYKRLQFTFFFSGWEESGCDVQIIRIFPGASLWFALTLF